LKERENRFYRDYSAKKGAAFRAAVETTDLFIRAEKDLTREALAAIRSEREKLVEHIKLHPKFESSLVPLEEPSDAPPIAAMMYRAAKAAGVGPMAAVAGAMAQRVGMALRRRSSFVIVENGGDIYLDTGRETLVGLWAGTSPFSGRVAIRVDCKPGPLGVCTSSGTVGPSLSFGTADAATIISSDAAFADAMASALGNRIQSPSDLEGAVEWAASVRGVIGALGIIGDKLAARGELSLEKIA
jgi:ApbE superfamily uncharacterized protein (UPF0280 family)